MMCRDFYDFRWYLNFKKHKLLCYAPQFLFFDWVFIYIGMKFLYDFQASPLGQYNFIDAKPHNN